MSLILVEGWGGSGKSLVLSYLDSHSQIMAMPVHDKLPYDVLNLDKEHLSIKQNDLRPIRSVLSSHGYYNIEYNATRSVIPVILSTEKDDIINIPFNFDFQNFEKIWKSFLIDSKKFSKNQLIHFFYKAFSLSTKFKDNKNIDTLKHYATLGDARSCEPKLLLNQFYESKIIYVRRSVAEIIAIRSNRNTPNGLAKGMFEKDFYELIFSGEIQKIINYEYLINKALLENKKRILIIDFDDVLYQKETIIKNILNFLHCKSEELTPTLLGYDIGDGSENYGSKKNDVADELLSTRKLKIIRIQEKIGRSSITLNRCIFAMNRALYIMYRVLRRINRILKIRK